MKTLTASTIALTLALSACSSEPQTATAPTNEADAFSQRINGTNAKPAPVPAGAPAPAPTVAQPLESVSSNPYAPGTATDPNSACNANTFGEFIGRQPSADVRAAIMEAAGDLPEVRFIPAGGDYVRPDPTNPRLNVMIAVDGIIRDIRCG